MNIGKILSFCTIVDQGNLSKAAELLYCSQPALSKQITSLEKEIGYPLFDRNGKKLTLNKNGELLYQFGKKLEQDLIQLKKDLYALNRPVANSIYFGVTNYIGIYLMPPVISEFKKKWPNIAINFTVDFLSNIIDLLEQDQISFALIPQSQYTTDNPKYICRFLCQDDMVLAFPNNHPLVKLSKITPQDIVNYPFLVSQVKSATREIIFSKLSSVGAIPKNIIDMHNTETIKQGIICGIGISILSRRSINNEINNKLLKVAYIEGLDLNRALYVIHKKNKRLSTETKMFINSLLETIQLETSVNHQNMKGE